MHHRENPTPLTEEQKALAAEWLPMARRWVARERKRWPNRDHDWDSAAHMAAIRAARDYDPGRGMKPATFLFLKFLHEVAETRRVRKLAPGVPLGPLHGVRQYAIDGLQLDWMAADCRDQVGPFSDRDHLDRLLSMLPPADATIVRLRFLEDRTLLEVGREVGLSESGVLRSVRRSLQRLRDHAARLEGECEARREAASRVG